MPTDERRRAMLAEMGLRVWSPPAAAAAVPAAAAVSAPARSRGIASVPQFDAAVDGARKMPSAAPSQPMQRPAATAPSGEGRVAVAGPAMASAARPQGLWDTVAHLEWDALRQAALGCQACGLCQTRAQAVFGVGHVRAHCMIVGEAPGAEEDRLGDPFVGKAGQLLDAMLGAIGLTRQEAAPAKQVYIANVLKCRPPLNRNPHPDEVAMCTPYLRRQIELVRPRLLLALGRFAIETLTGSADPVGRLRGRVHRYRQGDLDVPVVVSYHPAYLLRQPSEKAKSWEDLCLAADLLEAG